jgi:hypothetical protein
VSKKKTGEGEGARARERENVTRVCVRVLSD